MVITNGRTRFHQRTATVYEAFPLSEVRAWLLAGIRKSARSFAEDICSTGWPLRHVVDSPTGVSPPLRTHALEHVRPRHSLHMAASASYEEVSPRRSISSSTLADRPASASWHARCATGRDHRGTLCSPGHSRRARSDQRLFRQLRTSRGSSQCGEHPKRPECSRRNSSIDSDDKAHRTFDCAVQA